MSPGMAGHQHMKPLFMAKIDFLSHILIMGSKVYPGLALVRPGLQPPMVLSCLINESALIIQADKAGISNLAPGTY